MNRPFSAFGVLLSLLAVTMFAVSSTSRSTTVKPAAERANRSAFRRPVGYPHFDIAAATADRDGLDEGLCSPGSFEGEGGQGPGVRGQEPGGKRQEQGDRILENVTPSRLAPVQIEAVQDAVSWVVPEPMDVRSLYDAVYDWVVLGEDGTRSDGTPTRSAGAPVPTTEEPVRELSDSELSGLFHSILSNGRQPASGTSQRGNARGTEAGKSRTGTMLPALQNWARHQVELLWGQAVQSEAVDWAEYAELVDLAKQRQSTSADIASISVGE